MALLDSKGLNRGTSGNVSTRAGDGMLVSPSGVTPDRLTVDSVAYVNADGEADPDGFRPSSEWKMHFGLYQRCPDVHAIVHCHSRFATTLASAGHEIPSMHYMVAVGGGTSVPLAPYATFGSDELAAVVAEKMAGRRACLMANHGLITAGSNLRTALAIAEEIEEQAAVYWGTLAIGGPKLLTETQMAEVLQQFKGYGQAK